jgi:ABC-type sugar transport system permease subunit
VSSKLRRITRAGGLTNPWLVGYGLAAPALIVIGLVVLYPMVNAVLMSFTDRSLLDPGSGAWVGLKNYRHMLDLPLFGQALRNTAVWTVANVVLQMVIGTGLALLLNEKMRANAIMRATALIPYILPSVAAVLIWRYMFDPSVGVINSVLRQLGLVDKDVVWLGQTSTAMPAVIAESVWKGSPFVMLIVLAGLQTVPKELYEAAAIDGAGPWRRFRYVVAPHIRPTLALAAILTTVFTVNNFNAVWLMTQGGPLHSTEILFTLAYRTAFKDFDFGLAAAMSVVLFGFLILVGAVYVFLVERGERR